MNEEEKEEHSVDNLSSDVVPQKELSKISKIKYKIITVFLFAFLIVLGVLVLLVGGCYVYLVVLGISQQ